MSEMAFCMLNTFDASFDGFVLAVVIFQSGQRESSIHCSYIRRISRLSTFNSILHSLSGNKIMRLIKCKAIIQPLTHAPYLVNLFVKLLLHSN